LLLLLTGACESSADVGSLRDAGVRDRPAAPAPDRGLADRSTTDQGSPTVWAVSAGGPGVTTVGQQVGIDEAGNIFVGGSFDGLAHFGSTQLLTNAVAGAFVTKLAPDGKFLWSVSPTGVAQVTSLAVDAAGNCYVAGWAAGGMSFGLFGLPGEKGEAFLAKLDPAGAVLWLIPAVVNVSASRQALALRPAGDLFWAGSLQGNASFGKYPSETKVSTEGPTTAAVYVARITPAGDVLWISHASEAQPWTTSPNEVRALAADATGAYLVGRLYGEASFGLTTLQRKGSPHDLFVARLSLSGNFVWSTSGWAGGGTTSSSSVALSAGAGYLVGEATGTLTLGGVVTAVDQDAFLARFSAADGAIHWVAVPEGPGPTSLPGAVATSAGGSVFWTGEYEGAPGLGVSLPIVSGRAIFVGRADPGSGKALWATAATPASGSSGEGSSATSLAVDRAGYLVVTGAIDGVTSFGPGLSLAAKGKRDLFVWKLRPPGGPVP
jgi:hypothetical protein